MAAERRPASAWQKGAGGALAAVVVAIAAREGFRQHAYTPVKGDEVTIGYGSTRHADGTPIQRDETVTEPRARVMLQADASRIATAIARCIGDVPLYQHEWAAYVSLAYNIGSSAFCQSTIVRKLHQQPPDYAGACAQIRRWVYAQGRKVQGLVNRREVEYRQCVGGRKWTLKNG